MRIRTVTWNLGDAAGGNVDAWEQELNSWSVQGVDVFVIGVQEGKTPDRAIGKLLLERLGGAGWKLKTVTGTAHIEGKKVFLFIAYREGKERKTASVMHPVIVRGTPISIPFAKTKGTIGASMDMPDGTRVVFVNSHFPIDTGDKKTLGNKHRLAAFAKGEARVVKKLIGGKANHVVIWMGDLNFRIDEAGNDQLTASKAAFAKYLEGGSIFKSRQFAPTCKMRTNVSGDRASWKYRTCAVGKPAECQEAYDKMHKRNPSYCDRIMYRSTVPLRQIAYRAKGDTAFIKRSDHNAVIADFCLRC